MIIDYVENGNSFVDPRGWMNNKYREITKECYEALSQMDYAEVSDIIEAGLSEAERCGYGFYGHDLCKKDGKYYLGKSIGASCD